MSEDEFNAAAAGARQAQSGLSGVLSGLGAGKVCAPSMAPTGAANGQSIDGLLPAFSPSQIPLGGCYAQTVMNQPAYGEQGPDTDGLAAIQTRDAAWVRAMQNARLVSDGHEDDQPRRMPSDVAAALDTSTDVLVSDETWNGVKALVLARDDRIAELQARIARKEAANEGLVAKLGATLADMRSLQRQADNWRAECQRLSALLVETQQQLAQRMAMPANALRHGGVR